MPEINSAATFKEVCNTYLSEYPGEYALSESGVRKMVQLCGLVDLLAAQCDSDDAFFEVSPSDLHGSVVIHVDDLVFERGRSHPFFELVRNADALSFRSVNGEILEVRFTVQNLWETCGE